VAQILSWAEAHRERTGAWPTQRSGAVAEVRGLSWKAVNTALAQGGRGLPGGSSLARLLHEQRGRESRRREPLTQEQLLAWADAHRARTGTWPNAASGAVVEAPGETWRRLDFALRAGYRGLPGGDSLVRLLGRSGRGDSAVQPWTAAEDDLVRTLPPAEVAQRTGRTLAAVYTRRRNLHVKRSNAERDGEIVAQRAAGRKLAAIAARFGLSCQRVAQIVAGQREGKGEPAPSRLA
jgi:hypothetical protein